MASLFPSNLSNRSNTTRNATSTNSSSSTAQPDILYENLIISAQVFVYFCVGMHLIYLILVVFFRELRTRPLVFINHAVFANSLYPLGNIVFFYVDPNIINPQNPQLVRILCSFFEIFWPFCIYLRMYSILLIALHRYLAVFRSDVFRRLNDSHLYLVISITVTWLISIAISFILKYAFNTSYTLTNCLYGFSSSFTNSLVSTLLNTLFSLVLPAIAIVVVYIIIARRLNQLGDQLVVRRNANAIIDSGNSSRAENTNRTFMEQTSNTNTTSSTGGGGRQVKISKKKEMKFANQFILLCLLVVLTIMGIAIFSFRGVIPNYFNVMYYWRSVIRCYIMFFSTLVPIFAFYNNPSRNRLVSWIHGQTSSWINKSNNRNPSKY